MYDARRATGWTSVFFFVSLIIMGMMVVMNLFLAILLSNFTNKDDVDHEVEEAGGGGEQGNAGPPVEAPQGSRVTPYYPASPPASPGHSHAPATQPSESKGDICSNGKVVPTANVDEKRGHVNGYQQSPGAKKKGFLSYAAAACSAMGTCTAGAFASVLRGFQVPPDLNSGRALFVLGPRNFVRRTCAAIVANPGFDKCILLLISVSSIALALDNPLRDPDSTMAVALGHVERVMTELFFAEMALKIFAHGFVFMGGAYLRSGWNILDFAVVVISMVQLFDDSGNLESLRSLRTLRALRPLRYVALW